MPEFCPKCQSRVTPGDSFCIMCGAKLEKDKVADEACKTTDMPQSESGAKLLPPDTDNLPHAEPNRTSPNMPPNRPLQNSKIKKLLTPILTVVAVLAIFLGICYGADLIRGNADTPYFPAYLASSSDYTSQAESSQATAAKSSADFRVYAEAFGDTIVDNLNGAGLSAMDPSYWVSNESLWIEAVFPATRQDFLDLFDAGIGKDDYYTIVNSFADISKTAYESLSDAGFKNKNCMIEISLLDGTQLASICNGEIEFDLYEYSN